MAKLSRPIAALLLGIAAQTVQAADATSMLATRVKAAVYQLHTGYNSGTDDCGGLDKPDCLCSGISLRTTASRNATTNPRLSRQGGGPRLVGPGSSHNI